MKYLNDKSEAGVERWMVASAAFQRHDPMRKFADLNPMVQEHWLAITEAVLGVVYEAAGYAPAKTQRHEQRHLSQKAG
ncbi:MAG TPA: hypothetical protein VGK24_05225 [Candidatus Angelobacter sp.]|jgi:hypothetical protein